MGFWSSMGMLVCSSVFADMGKVKVLGYNIHGWEPSAAKLEEIVTKSGAEILVFTEA
jgi:hypothetical protein